MQVGSFVLIAVALVCAGVVWALQTSNAAVDSNLFGTADCFGAQLGSIQSGETVHATNGIQLEPITTVDAFACVRDGVGAQRQQRGRRQLGSRPAVG